MPSCGIRHPSVCPSVCECQSVCKYLVSTSHCPWTNSNSGGARPRASRKNCGDRAELSISQKCFFFFFFYANGWVVSCTRWSPDGPASRMCSRSRSRSKLTRYQHIWNFTKITSSPRQMAAYLPKSVFP